MNKHLKFRRTRTAGIAVSIGLFASACSGVNSEEISAEGTPSVVAETATTTTIANTPTALALTSAEGEGEGEDTASRVSSNSVVVIEAGAEPLVELRLEPELGARQLLVSQTQTFSQAINGRDLGGASTQTIESISSVDVGRDGDNFTIESIVESMLVAPDTNPEIAELLNAALAESVGLTTNSVVDDRGVLVQSSADGTDLALDEALSSLSEVSNPLPAEAVGVGAVWETTQTLAVLGFDVEQVTRTTITNIDGDVITLTIEGTQNVPVGSSVTSNGDVITVHAWDVDIEGTTVLDLGEAIPVEATTTTQTSQVLDIDGSIIDQSLELELASSSN